MHGFIQQLLDAYQHSLQTGGYPFIILLMALESSVVPIPSEVIIPPAVLIVMAGRSSMSVTGIVVAAVIGSWIGATLMYWGSRIAGRPLVVAVGRFLVEEPAKGGAAQSGFLKKVLSLSRWLASKLFITPDKISAAERWSERFGSFGIFLSRMLPVIRHLIGIPAGIVRMNFLKYSLYTFLGSAVWCSVLAWVSHVAGQDDRLMHGEIREVTLWATCVAAALGAAYYFLVHRMSRETDRG